MKPLNPMPKGAISTISQMRILCATGATIYEVNGVYPSVGEIDLTGMRVESNDIGHFIAPTGRLSHRYLADINVGDRHYNANYVFVLKEDAEAHARFALNDPAMVADRNEWINECDRWDDMFDDYYDQYYDRDYDDE